MPGTILSAIRPPRTSLLTPAYTGTTFALYCLAYHKGQRLQPQTTLQPEIYEQTNYAGRISPELTH